MDDGFDKTTPDEHTDLIMLLEESVLIAKFGKWLRELYPQDFITYRFRNDADPED